MASSSANLCASWCSSAIILWSFKWPWSVNCHWHILVRFFAVFRGVIVSATYVSRKADQIQRQCPLFSISNIHKRISWNNSFRAKQWLIIHEGNSNSAWSFFSIQRLNRAIFPVQSAIFHRRTFFFLSFLRVRQVSFKIHNSWPSETIYKSFIVLRRCTARYYQLIQSTV